MSFEQTLTQVECVFWCQQRSVEIARPFVEDALDAVVRKIIRQAKG